LKGKSFIEVRCIPLGRTYDYFVPLHITVGAAIKLMSATLGKEEGVCFKEDGLLLCDVDKKRILNDDETLAAAGISEGATLLLV